MTPKQRATESISRLRSAYPEARCSLNYTSAFELLIATILSAQTTDVRVNQVTERLFAEYPHPGSYRPEQQSSIESIIRPLGCYKSKTTRIIQTAEKIVHEFNGSVPATMEELITLPGVGRKTANVVLSNAFDVPGFAVDTHVKRVAYRLGITTNRDPEMVEKDLCAIIEAPLWGLSSHLFIFHGRNICRARKPSCSECQLEDICLKRI